MEKAGYRNLPLGWRDLLDTPITEEQMKVAVSKGACSKAPRRDGIYLDFFKLTETTSRMACSPYSFRCIGWSDQGTTKSWHSSRTDIPNTPADYRPVIWLNTGYKILALITANQIRPTLSDMLHPSQYCGVSCNTIFDAVMTVRDAIA